MEIYKQIEGFGNMYFVSNYGNVKSNHKRNKNKKLKKIKDIYLYVNLFYKGNRQKIGIHIFVATYFHENPENKKHVNHKDGDKTNNNDWNLEWNTPLENITHSIENGLSGTGNKKLSKDQVKEIRLIKNKTYKSISETYNVHRTTISNIINNKTWTGI